MREIFKTEFSIIYEPSEKCYNFVETVWKIYSEILPIKTYPGEEQENHFRNLARDDKFQKRVIDSGISEKLKSGVSLDSLLKDSKVNSFS